MKNKDFGMSIKQWYLEAYPNDTLGGEIREGLTFSDAYRALENKACIYEALGVCDSVIRERVFDQLAQISGVDYGVIYDMWCYEKMPLLDQLQSASGRTARIEVVPSPEMNTASPER